MLLGTMNSPKENLFTEITRIGSAGFDFIDLTMEFPGAIPDLIVPQKKKILDALSTSKLKVVGHCPWYFYPAHPYDSLRSASLQELKKCIEAAAALGANKVGIHPDPRAKLYDSRGQYFARLASGAMELNKAANDNGVILLMEPYTAEYMTLDELTQLFYAAPTMRLTLDYGHANLFKPEGKGITEFLSKFAQKINHVHLSDNHGKEDEHIGLGKGSINWQVELKRLKSIGYDGTIALEVFSGKEDLEESMMLVKNIWKSID